MDGRTRLSEEDRRELLRVARAAIEEFTQNGRLSAAGPGDAALPAAGAFVTLRAGGALRGCVGTQVADTPLDHTIREMAVAAATRDPRFDPVSAAEVGALTIEISILGARERIRGPAEVEIGRDGLAIHWRGRRGLLLPQVAVENAWDPTTFVARVCAKAGLPDDAWRSPEATLERFTAQHFDEREVG